MVMQMSDRQFAVKFEEEKTFHMKLLTNIICNAFNQCHQNNDRCYQ